MSSLLDPNQTFKDLGTSVGLDNRLQKALSRLGHVRPTLVQSQCLPLALRDGRDLLVKARTGSGKTLAYCLPLLQKILKKEVNVNGAQAIILVPSKELCAQVSGIVQTLSYYATDVIRVAVLFGKSKAERAKQEVMWRDAPNVIVATPASLLYFLTKETYEKQVKDTVETLVIDEADLILSFGCTEDISAIMKRIPKICQSMLMSATLPDELSKLKSVVLHSPAIVKLEEDENDDLKKKQNLSQFYLAVPKKDKGLILYVFLKLGLLKGKGLFFVNSIDAAYRLKLFFELFHIRSAVLNSELPLQSRLNILEHYNVGNFEYLICTDGFSRGNDFRLVSFVVNVDLPATVEEYTHRIGRTARGGHKGVALTLISQESQQDWNVLTEIQNSQPMLKRSPNSIGSLNVQRPEGDETITDIPQPSPLDFDLSEAEGFRYRVEDVSGAVTKIAVREARANELKAELLNNERLTNHLGKADLQLLQHDRVSTKPTKIQEHLKHIPKYMLPRGMQVAELHKRRKKRKISNGGAQRRTDNDPLQSFDNTPDVDGAFDEFFDDGDVENPKKAKTESEKEIYTSTKDGLGKSTSGRNAWKEQHKKGKFSHKRRKSEPKKRTVGV
jgi:ATP-dependent RNA helicase DDX56/DBP9